MNETEIIEALWELSQLHRELASLYYTRSRDQKRINILWSQIESREETLKINGVEGEWD